MSARRKLKIFTWHVHGTYLYYLSKGDFDLYIPTRLDRKEGYYGRGHTFPFGPNVIEIAADQVRHEQFDCILFQTTQNYLVDQFDILSPEQRKGPRVFLQHDPPWGHPTDSVHVVKDQDVLLVHVTHFNALMWNTLELKTQVIEHGISFDEVPWRGDLGRGLVMVNNLADRGRLLGLDIFQQLRKVVPLDLIGLNSGALEGLGEVLHPQLPSFLARYRFFFNPIRYTSLGLSVLEAMHAGLPVVGLATTEMVTVIENGRNGYLDTNPDRLVEKMQLLLKDQLLAKRLGQAGRQTVRERFSIRRFVSDWDKAFRSVINTPFFTDQPTPGQLQKSNSTPLTVLHE